MTDRPLPQNRDLISHSLRAEGAGPKVTHIAVFDYEDGSQREFDGSAWTVTLPSRRNDERTPASASPSLTQLREFERHDLGAWNGLA